LRDGQKISQREWPHFEKSDLQYSRGGERLSTDAGLPAR